MTKVPEACRATLDEDVKALLAICGGRLVEKDDIIQAIREAGKRKRWAWVEQWVNEEAPQHVNDMDTVFFELTSGDLTWDKSLEFTQQVWRLQPSVFEYQTWIGRHFVRIWWDRNRFQGKTLKA